MIKLVLVLVILQLFLGCKEEDTTKTVVMIDAGSNQNVKVGKLVTLDASKSHHEYMKKLSYNWSILSKPYGSRASLSDASEISPTFVADTSGTYTLNLKIDDYDNNVTIKACVIDTNSQPVADAGVDRNVKTGTSIRLDGSKSSDADNNDTLIYRWTIITKPENSNARLSNNLEVNPIFSPDVDGRYSFGLIVADSTNGSDVSELIVMSSSSNSKPIADAGKNFYVTTSSVVTLDASASSDANGAMIDYTWSLAYKPQDSNATLSDTSIVNPTFLADTDGSYAFSLQVYDGDLKSNIDTIVVKSTKNNLAPTADAGVDKYAKTGSKVMLDGSKSIDTTSSITYLWKMISKPKLSSTKLEDVTEPFPSFMIDVDGSYVVSLVVNDGTEDSKRDSVVVVGSSNELIPVADARRDKHILTGTSVQLNAKYISELDYQWRVKSKPKNALVTFSNIYTHNPIVEVDRDGTYLLSLVVGNGINQSDEDMVVIKSFSKDIVPLIDIDEDKSVLRGTDVVINSSYSQDIDADVFYNWKIVYMPKGSSSKLSTVKTNATSINVDKLGTYIIALTPYYKTVELATQMMVIKAYNSIPVANITSKPVVDTRDIVILDGSKSYDDGNDKLCYKWRVIDKPKESNVELIPVCHQDLKQEVKIDFAGKYVFGLVVNDGLIDSKEDNSSTVAIAGYNLDIVDSKGRGYKAIRSDITDRIWLDRNLGASGYCRTIDDKSCFGDYYQWGRKTDGHEIFNSNITDIKENNLKASSSFVIHKESNEFSIWDSDWAVKELDSTGDIRKASWIKADGSMCPVGYRVPTKLELYAETKTIDGHISSKSDIEDNFLKIPIAGMRGGNGNLAYLGNPKKGFLWSTDTERGNSFAYFLMLSEHDQAKTWHFYRIYGMPVRCINEN